MERKQGIVGSKNDCINQQEVELIQFLNQVLSNHNDKRNEGKKEIQSERKKEEKQVECVWTSQSPLFLNYIQYKNT